MNQVAYSIDAKITAAFAVDRAGLEVGFAYLTLLNGASKGEGKKDGEDEDLSYVELHGRLW